MATCYGFLICLKDDKEQSLKQDTENLLLVKVEYKMFKKTKCSKSFQPYRHRFSF